MRLPKQFSLKALLLAIAALALLLALPRQRALRQQYALRRMGAEIGGGVGLESQNLASRLFFGNCDGDRATDLIFRDVALSDADAARLALFPRLDAIRLHNCPDPERTILVLHRAHLNLTWLTITDTHLTDLRDIADFYNLRILSLISTDTSDVSLSPIGELYYLSTLRLKEASIHGPGLTALQKLPCLKNLGLQGCPIDDSGLEYLKSGFPALRYLQLQRTKVSKYGVERLQQALQECQIESDYDIGRVARRGWHL